MRNPFAAAGKVRKISHMKSLQIYINGILMHLARVPFSGSRDIKIKPFQVLISAVVVLGQQAPQYHIQVGYSTTLYIFQVGTKLRTNSDEIFRSHVCEVGKRNIENLGELITH